MNEKIIQLYKWEREQHKQDVRELANKDRLAQTLAAYFLFVYKPPEALQTAENCGNGVVCNRKK